MKDAVKSASESSVRFTWARPESPCEWRRDYEPMWPDAVRTPTPFHDDPKGPWLLCPERGRPYEPLRRHRDLHLEFARLPLADDEASLRTLAEFASRYGELGLATLPIRASSPTSGDSLMRSGEHHADWRRAIRRIGGLVELLDAHRSADLERVRHYVRWREGARAVDLAYRWPGDAKTTRTPILRDIPTARPGELAQLEGWRSSSLDRERYLAPLEHFLYREINASLGEHLRPHLRPQGGLELRCDSLLGALYVLLAEQLAGVWPMNRCAACGGLFLPRSRRDQKTCSTACRKRLSREGGER